MKFFIDTANIDEIKRASELGVLDGVTTNPSLMAKESGDPKKILSTICELVDGPISAEVIALDYKGMLKEAEELAGIHENIVIKLPITEDGLKACKTLTSKGIHTNLTLCFSPMQALLVAKAGGTYVSPFVGRLDDVSHNGMELIRQIVQIYKNYGYETQVLAASIRHPLHVVDSALAGAHVATIPFKVISQLIKHPLTDIGINNFLNDWKKAGK
ncbi:fructose-6-phosphate aldolase [bacterium]|jgi:transaldolase|nr:fructose-6-phosphate aldolase [bacterium]